MKKTVLFLFLLLLLCAGCAAESGGSDFAGSAPEGTSSAVSELPVFGEQSFPESYSLPDESDVGSGDVAPTETLLQCFPGLTAAETQTARAFFAFVGETFGETVLERLAREISENGYTDAVWRAVTGNSLHVLRTVFAKEHETKDNVRLVRLGMPNADKTTVMTFGGDICFADNYVVMQYLKTAENGLADCIDRAWFDVMQGADLAVLNNEFAISRRGSAMAGKVYTFLAEPSHTALYGELGVDFVTLANNHVYDFGGDAFCDTLDTLASYGIGYAGAGRNAEEAERPFYYLVDGRKFAFVSATRAEKYILTPAAGENTSGVFRCYDPDRLLEVIAEAKANSDYVVLFVHWGKEGSHELEDVQAETSHLYIDAGADLIIGAHAHRLQGIEFYNGKAIFYNLGNFWFDDYDIETGLVKLELDADGTERLYFLPGMQSGCVTTYELGTATGRAVLDHVQSYLPGICIADDGLVTEKN